MNYFHDIIQQFLGIFIYTRNLAAKSNILNFLWAVYQACNSLWFAVLLYPSIDEQTADISSFTDIHWVPLKIWYTIFIHFIGLESFEQCSQILQVLRTMFLVRRCHKTTNQHRKKTQMEHIMGVVGHMSGWTCEVVIYFRKRDAVFSLINFLYWNF